MQYANEHTFNTKDFYLSAFLLAKGFQLIATDRKNPRQVYFAFKNIEGKDRLVEDFLFGRAVVEPKSFITAIKELKQLLHSHD